MNFTVPLFERRRVRLIRQSEIAECGLACIAMVADYHGLRLDVGQMRQQFKLSQRGSSLTSLIKVATDLNLNARAVRLELEQLARLKLPAVLHWDFNHFVVLEKVQNGRALIHNPDGQSAWISAAEISRHFTGVALELSVAHDFIKADHRAQAKLWQLWQGLSGFKSALLQIVILSFLMQAFVLLSHYYMQVAIDSVVPASDVDMLLALALGFAAFTIINSIAVWFRGYVILSAGSSLGYGLATNVARKLFRLPIEWFERRHVGDVLSRFQSLLPIQTFLTEGATAAAIDGSLAILIVAIMPFYSPLLAFMTVLSCAVYASLRIALFYRQRSAQEAAIISRAKEQTSLIESIAGISTLRLANREVLRHAFWQTRLTDAMNSAVELGRVIVWQATAKSLVSGLTVILTVYIGIRLVLDGGFSLGMLFAFLTYQTQVLERSSSLVEQWVAFRMLDLHVDRVSEIAVAAEDVSFRQGVARHTPLIGKIELRNVRYRYAPGEPDVLDGVNLVIEPGEHVAITGPSGGGKSTLVKIMLGLIEPDSGDVLIDDMPLTKFGYQSYRDQVAAVLQHDHLFLGSISENISLFDENIRLDAVKSAAIAAAINDDIAEMPMGYQTLVGSTASTLSGGQKQRILLARALYRQPRLLILDEGTSHLDIDHERRVNEAVTKLGVTRVIIAHREETISSAGRVLLLKNRKIVSLDEKGRPILNS